MNLLFKNALASKEQKTPPIWFMRQAGRYHSHYQALRKEHSFLELCRNPKLAAQVALGPIQDFDFDAAILFSDILYPLDALGMTLSFPDQGGPKLDFYLQKSEDLKKLKNPEHALDALAFQKEALIETRKVLPAHKSLIGFVGAPWTLFSYAVQGTHSGGVLNTKKALSLYKPFIENYLLPLLKKNIQLQLDGGAEMMMLFDTAAGELSSLVFQELCEVHLLELAKEFPGKLGYYSKSTAPDFFSEKFLSAPWTGFGFDHRVNLTQLLAHKKTPGFLQGNFDQAFLHMPFQDFDRYLNSYLDPFEKLSSSQRASWVCGLGHGVLPQTPEAHVKHFIKTVRAKFS